MKNDVNGQMDLLDLLGIEKEVEQKPEKETETKNKEAENETRVIEFRRYFAPVSAGTGVELEPYENQKKLKMFQILLKYPKRKQKQKNINALS